jgi:1-acyl-sn-glycerol-3-phosphate acyltransferase
MVFPEGTRMKHGETRRYGVSGSLLAAAANVCVVPVAHNAGHYWPRRGIMKKPGTIRVVIGKPVPAADRDVRELNAEVQEWIETTIRGLS